MNRRTIVSLAGFALLVLAGPASGQAKKPVRTATIPASPPAQPIVVNTTGLPTANIPAGVVAAPSNRPVYGTPAQVVQITYYPTVVLSDGRVLANFGTGRGYEQVLRQCPQFSGTMPPNAIISACWTVDSYGNYRVIQQR
jgi:hypothetical protein